MRESQRGVQGIQGIDPLTVQLEGCVQRLMGIMVKRGRSQEGSQENGKGRGLRKEGRNWRLERGKEDRSGGEGRKEVRSIH